MVTFLTPIVVGHQVFSEKLGVIKKVDEFHEEKFNQMSCKMSVRLFENLGKSVLKKSANSRRKWFNFFE